jgi:hypothetical protein
MDVVFMGIEVIEMFVVKNITIKRESAARGLKVTSLLS